MLLQLLNDKDIKFCLANWDVNEDGAKSQPLSEEYKIKQNTESSSISNEVRDFIFQKIYGNHYINSVNCINNYIISLFKKEGICK